MAFSNTYTAVTGGTLSAAQWNTGVRDNLTALWTYTTAGDIEYATSSTALARLGIGDVGQVLRVASSGVAPEWTAGIVTTDEYADATGHTYNSSTERDMPNSDTAVTVDVTSTVIMMGHVVASTATGNQQINIYPYIDGAQEGTVSVLGETSSGVRTIPFFARATGVSAGTPTLKLREKQTYSGNTYTVYTIYYVVIIIPE